MQVDLKKLSKLADTCQYKAYQLNYTEPDTNIGWWGLHETISLFDYYIIEEDEDHYMHMAPGLLEMLEEIPKEKLDSDFKELISMLQVLITPPNKV